MKPNSPRIFIDADACPVRNETINIAGRHKLEIFFVSNGGIRPINNPLVRNIIVENTPDAADKWIVKEILPNDIVVTEDIILAEKCIKKNASVLSHQGKQFTLDNIGIKVATRELMAMIRSSNPFHKNKGKPLSKNNKISYSNQLEKIIQFITKSL